MCCNSQNRYFGTILVIKLRPGRRIWITLLSSRFTVKESE